LENIAKMAKKQHDPWLLTPGPLTTSAGVKSAMLHDWGSRDSEFIAINAQVREQLVALAGGEGTHVCVPVQGSGTFAVEATIGTYLSTAPTVIASRVSAITSLATMSPSNPPRMCPTIRLRSIACSSKTPT
jgi:aspartate aminotransferase-like enzyme